MAIAGHHPTATGRQGRPPSVISAVSILSFLGVTAVGGGIGFFFDIGMRDDRWMEQIPLVTNWAIPGIVLGVGFGLGSLLTAFGVLRRPDWSWLHWLERATGHHWAWAATLALGVGMLAWVGLQLIWLSPHFLHAIYGVVGAALIGLSLTRSYRSYLTPGP
jgi:hypothetical protein